MSDPDQDSSQTVSGIVSREDASRVLGATPIPDQSDSEETQFQDVSKSDVPGAKPVIASDFPKELVLGDYELMGKLGSGGMGVVFKAIHRRMNRVVALKVLPPGVIESVEKIQRFAQEVKAAAKLSHKNIVHAYDARASQGINYLVMEYIEGKSLADLVKGVGPLPVDRAIDYVLQTARGLEYAHGEGVVHRDIKPHNLLVDTKGVVKILDMGLARLTTATNRGLRSTADSKDDSKSGTGSPILGTVDYMAPEQALDNEEADQRSDIYSLGCTLFYLLVGRSPYGGETMMKKLVAHREQPIPSLKSLRPDVPESLDAAFMQMLAKDPKTRYQTMTPLIRDLENTQRRLASGLTGKLDDAFQDLSSSEVYVGRQPVYDKDLNVVAYTLLYRDSNENRARFADGDQATSQLLINAVLEIGLDTLVGDHLALINLTRPFIVGEYPLPAESANFAMEISGDVDVDQRLVESLQGLAAQGKTIVLDNFAYRPEIEPLLRVAKIVAISIQGVDQAVLRARVEQFRRPAVKLLATKVETNDDFKRCLQLGFDCFQGYFLCRPRIIQGQRLAERRLTVLRLLAKIQDPKVEFKELDTMIQQDVSLSYKLLRYINSAFYGLRKKVDSIHQALVFLGIGAIKNLLTLVKLSAIDDKPHDLVRIAMTRAKMCEIMGQTLSVPDHSAYFTAGLFSVLDALLDRPIDEVVGMLPLSEEINRALVDYAGIMGQALRSVIAYEQGKWDEVSCPGLEAAQIKDAYLKAIAWAKTVDEQLSG